MGEGKLNLSIPIEIPEIKKKSPKRKKAKLSQEEGDKANEPKEDAEAAPPAAVVENWLLGFIQLSWTLN